MHTDCYFATGSSHSVCQDYALARDNYVIISDGCSSSPHTDFGARILVHSFDQVLQHHLDADKIIDRAITIASAHARAMSLPQECLDATLLYVRIDGEFINWGIYGDGAIAVRNKDGSLITMYVEYEANAPHYPNYDIDHPRYKLYLEEYKPNRKIEHWGDESINRGGECVNARVWPIDDISAFAIMSDGVQSFIETTIDGTSKHQKPMAINDVIEQIMAFKLTKGKFVERRVKRFLKDCQKQDIQHYDDVAVGAIYIDEDYRKQHSS